jgi:hypothetical protein
MCGPSFVDGSPEAGVSTRSPVFFQKYKTEIKDLEHQGELGNGTCGHVVRMLHKPSQTVIAVKVSQHKAFASVQFIFSLFAASKKY